MNSGNLLGRNGNRNVESELITMRRQIWLIDLRDRRVIWRAIKTAIVVGITLVAITQGASVLAGEFSSRMAWQIPLTVMVPFAVSLLTSATVVGSARRANAATQERLRDQLEAINKYPNLNPNPVMRISLAGDLLYLNSASEPITAALGITEGDQLPANLFKKLTREAKKEVGGPIEIQAGVKTYSLLPVIFDDLDFINVYGTDITAKKVLNKFPDLNPNPVMKMTGDGTLDYANTAASAVVTAMGMVVGGRFDPDVIKSIEDICNDRTDEPLLVSGNGRTYSLTPVYTPEFEITNIYGLDITARAAMNKFPDQNPNPVLRVSKDGDLEYANPASELVMKAIRATVGEKLPEEFFTKIKAISDSGSSEALEVSTDGRTFSLLVVGVFEFGFINLYGTEITAALELEEAHEANEILLLNILPASIAERLKKGEGLIADRFEDMSVLFADVVGFTQISRDLSPSALVEMLNHIFSLFDRVAERLVLEKIKTMGDAYMVAGGLGTDGQGDAEKLADMGLEMLELLEKYRAETGTDIRIRIGMHTGVAVAGVVGLKKFIYDVWGEAVNTASRMESHGVPDRIQVLGSTTKKLASTHLFEERGKVDVKGSGMLTTYFLTGRRDRQNGAGSK